MARSTQEVFTSYQNALERGDLPALMADFGEDAVLITMDAVHEGKEAIQGFYARAFAVNPNLTIKGTGAHVCGDVVLCTWTGDSDVGRVPTGVDTFLIRDDRIRLRTVWLTLVPKQVAR